MSNLDILANMIADAIKQKDDEKDNDSENKTYGYAGIYSNGYVEDENGKVHAARLASLDIRLKNGCTVFCVNGENEEAVIVGGGVL